MSEIATVDEHEEVLALRRKVDELETQLEWFRKPSIFKSSATMITNS